MGILKPSHLTTPSTSDTRPLQNAWNRYTVKKLRNISGVASTRIRRNWDASSTVSSSGMKRCENALRSYQRQSGLTADGICGCNTWKKITAASVGIGRTKTVID